MADYGMFQPVGHLVSFRVGSSRRKNAISFQLCSPQSLSIHPPKSYSFLPFLPAPLPSLQPSLSNFVVALLCLCSILIYIYICVYVCMFLLGRALWVPLKFALTCSCFQFSNQPTPSESTATYHLWFMCNSASLYIYILSWLHCGIFCERHQQHHHITPFNCMQVLQQSISLANLESTSWHNPVWLPHQSLKHHMFAIWVSSYRTLRSRSRWAWTHAKPESGKSITTLGSILSCQPHVTSLHLS